MSTLNFDANQVAPCSGRDPLPAGKYLAVITASEMKPTKSGNGKYLSCEYQILDGDHKGRKVWSRHTLEHPNPETVKIARGELSSICRAVGVMTPTDSAELHNLPMIITVKCSKRPDNGELTNDIVAWTKKEATSGVPAQAVTNNPPWTRRA